MTEQNYGAAASAWAIRIDVIEQRVARLEVQLAAARARLIRTLEEFHVEGNDR
jgi:hypothetical protein